MERIKRVGTDQQGMLLAYSRCIMFALRFLSVEIGCIRVIVFIALGWMSRFCRGLRLVSAP